MSHVAKILLACAILLGPAACAVEDPEVEAPIGALAQDIRKDQLGPGYSCVPDFQPMTDLKCTKCVAVVDNEGHPTGEKECTAYYCNSSTGDCPIVSTWTESATYDMDRNWWFEAEDGALTAPMQKLTTAGASNGSAIAVTDVASAGGVVSFTFDVTEPVTVYPWARVRTPSTSADSFWFRFDNGPLLTWNAAAHPAWTWLQVQDAASAPRSSAALAVGTHKLRIYRVDAGAFVDRVLLTASSTFVPVADTYEAESGARVAPMQQGTMMLFPVTTYMWVPNGAGTGGSLDLSTPVPVAGHYSIWGRVNAPSGADNSFFVAANFDEAATWHTPTTSSSGWAWAQVRDYGVVEPFLFEMHASYDFVRITQREDGTRLDKIIVTNDPGFVPVDVPVILPPQPVVAAP